MTNLPTFPNFTHLEITHKETLRSIAASYPTYSDFNFVSLFTWDHDDSIYVSNLNNNLVIQFKDYTSEDVFLSFLGINKLALTIEVLLDYSKKNGIKTHLSLIGQSIIDELTDYEKRKYVIEEDRDNHDYILSTILLSDIERNHPQKRTKYRKFEREFGNMARFNKLDLSSQKVISDIEELLISWKKIRLKDDIDVYREYTAIHRALLNVDILDLLGFGTYVDDELIVFTLYEIVHNNTAMLHFGKSNTKYVGSSETHHIKMANFMFSEGVTYMNNEQDLGIKGLRHSKMASQPTHFLKKYKISHNLT